MNITRRSKKNREIKIQIEKSISRNFFVHIDTYTMWMIFLTLKFFLQLLKGKPTA